MTSPVGSAPALEYIVIAVADPARSLDWLAQALSASASSVRPAAGARGIRAGVLSLDGGRLELIEAAQTAGAGSQLNNNDTGAVHICLRTADIEAAHRRLCAAGARFSTEPQVVPAGPAIAYFRDPGGLQFQLIQLAAGPLAGGEQPGPVGQTIGRLHHLGLTVPNLDEAVRWYEEVLGLVVTVRSEAAGALAATMFGLSDAAYRAAVLAVGEHWLELLDFERPPGAAQPPAPDVAGAARACFSVADLAGVRRRLHDRGAEIAAEPAISEGPLAGATAITVEGPGGPVTLSQRPSSSESA